MARAQFEREAGYAYVSLADPATLSQARHDITGWIQRLPKPVVIDEAQLVEALPLAVKEFVDRAAASDNQFILTGSASIGRTGLGGADPLARRAVRMTMTPLTGWELAEQHGSLVDALFDGELTYGTAPELSDTDLLAAMAYGGFPSYVVPNPTMSRSRLRERISSDITAILSKTAVPDDMINAVIAHDVLDLLLRTPGGIFNASRMGQLLGVDQRTVDRYLAIFGRLFLVHWLPNLATRPAAQTHTRSKVHPSDTSFSVDSLERSCPSILDQRELFGQVLESYVVQQITSATPWARRQTAAYYWRLSQNPKPEVDLVLLGWGGKSVGVEVKAATTVNSDDLKGLRALRKVRGLDRGYVVYTGSQIQEIDDQIWALPVATLSTAAAFGEFDAKAASELG
jgi:predicted AAA+ superfamily ATPase